MTLHMHYWPNGQEEFYGRVDACLLKDGMTVVWDVDEDKILWRGHNFDEACRVAEREARNKA